MSSPSNDRLAVRPVRLRATLGVLAALTGFLLACGSGEEAPAPAPEPAPAPAEPAPAPPPAPAGPAGAGTKADPKILDCATKGRDLVDVSDQAFVRCPAGCTSGSVWGTCEYTNDSSICVAAVHAGAVTTDGGEAKFASIPGNPGPDGYKGSSRNGVTSSNWNSYDKSFKFGGVECSADGAPAPAPGGGGGRPGSGGGGGGGGGHLERVKRPTGSGGR